MRTSENTEIAEGVMAVEDTGAYDHEVIELDDELDDDLDFEGLWPVDEPDADPSCIACGGQGGWCGDFSPVGLCIWVACDCAS